MYRAHSTHSENLISKSDFVFHVSFSPKHQDIKRWRESSLGWKSSVKPSFFSSAPPHVECFEWMVAWVFDQIFLSKFQSWVKLFVLMVRVIKIWCNLVNCEF